MPQSVFSVLFVAFAMSQSFMIKSTALAKYIYIYIYFFFCSQFENIIETRSVPEN